MLSNDDRRPDQLVELTAERLERCQATRRRDNADHDRLTGRVRVLGLLVGSVLLLSHALSVQTRCARSGRQPAEK